MFAVRTCIQWRAVHVPFSGPNNMSAKCPNWQAIHTTSPRLQSYMVRGTPFWSGGRGRGLRTCTHAWAGGSGTRMLTRENFWNFSLFDVWKCIMDCGRFVPGIEALVKKINGAKRWFEGDGREGDYSCTPCAVTVVSESRSCVQRRKVCMAPLESAGNDPLLLRNCLAAEPPKAQNWQLETDEGIEACDVQMPGGGGSLLQIPPPARLPPFWRLTPPPPRRCRVFGARDWIQVFPISTSFRPFRLICFFYYRVWAPFAHSRVFNTAPRAFCWYSLDPFPSSSPSYPSLTTN